ncbi:MAG: carbamate kinase [Lachnospiraceae bacterium]|jgi:carbamate kinase|uniref:carbamate kinase n=1 Tax=Clostridia TaxID=186801 RepID=UPI000E53D677|nr:MULTISPECIES: carbamate kinase [Clostridia]MBS5190496.1 carbamate kinase [Lachnospiraceae bacterium]RHV69921.1 carbamate kinase [Roseburia sp. OM02-15]
MGKKRIVIALGGNALGKNLPEQYLAVQETSRAIADLIEAGNEVIISHGNGPQVGMINNAMAAYSKTEPSHPAITPLSVCVAMSQAYIGYDLQNALKEELLNRGIKKNVATVITQVRVDENDPAFEHPTKPIGQFMTKEEADAAVASSGIQVMEDAGRGYRRVVASPKPAEIIEIDTVKDLLNAGEVVIASGGGGIPVIRQGNHLKGVGAVIDKDFASCLLAQQLNADFLIILTAVEKVALRFGTPEETWLDDITVDEAKQYMEEGHFAPGSMLPKVQAGVEFAESGEGRTALITLLQKAKDGVNGATGTRIIKK